jgi:hypothetical protein
MGETAHAERGATVWRRATGTAYVEPAGRVVVLDLDHADLPPYLLEGSAAHICARLDGYRTEVQVVDEVAEADVCQLADRLRELGLIMRDPVR